MSSTSTTIYTTTSTARPEPPIIDETETETDDKLQKCDVEGLPSSKEEGKKQLEELVTYADFQFLI